MSKELRIDMKPTSSPYTVEGMIEGLGSFASGANRARGWRRRAAQGVALLIVGPWVVLLAAGVVVGLFTLVRAALP